MSPAGRRALLLAAAVGASGCVSRGELVRQDRQLRGLILEQRRQLEQVQREVERLRGDLEEAGVRRRGGGPNPTEERLADLEQRLAALERGGTPPPPPGEEGAEVPPPYGTPPTTTPLAALPTTTLPPVPPEDDAWRREIVREQAAAGAVNVPERAEYLQLLDGLVRKDCARAVPQLNGFAAKHKGSPLADNALYWAARCYDARGDENQAITKYYDLVQQYPRGDKTAAALWAQGNLFLSMGNTGDARLVLSKLIRDFPGSDEAAQARQRLTEIER